MDSTIGFLKSKREINERAPLPPTPPPPPMCYVNPDEILPIDRSLLFDCVEPKKLKKRLGNKERLRKKRKLNKEREMIQVERPTPIPPLMCDELIPINSSLPFGGFEPVLFGPEKRNRKGKERLRRKKQCMLNEEREMIQVETPTPISPLMRDELIPINSSLPFGGFEPVLFGPEKRNRQPGIKERLSRKKQCMLNEEREMIQVETPTPIPPLMCDELIPINSSLPFGGFEPVLFEPYKRNRQPGKKERLRKRKQCMLKEERERLQVETPTPIPPLMCDVNPDEIITIASSLPLDGVEPVIFTPENRKRNLGKRARQKRKEVFIKEKEKIQVETPTPIPPLMGDELIPIDSSLPFGGFEPVLFEPYKRNPGKKERLRKRKQCMLKEERERMQAETPTPTPPPMGDVNPDEIIPIASSLPLDGVEPVIFRPENRKRNLGKRARQKRKLVFIKEKEKIQEETNLDFKKPVSLQPPNSELNLKE